MTFEEMEVEYRRLSLVDRALGRMACAVSGHRWWRVIDARVCSQCGRVDSGYEAKP